MEQFSVNLGQQPRFPLRAERVIANLAFGLINDHLLLIRNKNHFDDVTFWNFLRVCFAFVNKLITKEIHICWCHIWNRESKTAINHKTRGPKTFCMLPTWNCSSELHDDLPTNTSTSAEPLLPAKIISLILSLKSWLFNSYQKKGKVVLTWAWDFGSLSVI